MLAAFVASASWQLALAAGGALLGRAVTGPRGRRVTGVVSAAGHRRPGRPYDDVVTLSRRRDAPHRGRRRRRRRSPAAPGVLARGLRADHRPRRARSSTSRDAAGLGRPLAGADRGRLRAPAGRRRATGPRSGFARGRGQPGRGRAGHPGAVRPLRPGGLARHRHRPRPLRRRGRRRRRRILWVLEDNARARAFYRRQGFAPDGARERYEPLVRLGDQDGRADDLPRPRRSRVRRHLARGARGPGRALVGGDELRLGGAAVRRGERVAARPPVPAGQRAVAGAERPALRPVRRLVEGDPAQPRGRRPRPAAAAADPRRSASRTIAAMRPALPGAGRRARRRRSRTAGGSSSSASSRSRTPPGSSACSSGCPRTTGARSRTGPTTWASPSGSAIADDLPRIEAALEGLHGYIDEVVADRRAHPRDDLVSTLVAGRGGRGPADAAHELGVALVFLAFAGMETTRNQLGLGAADAAGPSRPVAAARRRAPSSAGPRSRR